MPLAPGTRIGVYEIVDALGAGGMGEVYRARDTKLKRDVAIKILPEAFTLDAERVARFQREAELLASLNHPNIAAIYGVEESGDANAIVMELVEGETLGAPLPLEDALAIARQIVDALEAAHERGVIHRDLKPANIKVTPDGKVKVLDFGLAKAIDGGGAGRAGGAGGADGLSLSPTLSVHATYAGVILGTAAYMSPEQARGKPVDRRTDIWAFGCVLYEMLAGKQAFDAGETVSDAIATILKGDVDWNALPAATPAHVRSLLRRCLQKDPQKRLPHIGVVRLELDDPPTTDGAPAVSAARSTTPARPLWQRAIVPIACALVAGAIAATAAWFLKPPPAAPIVRFPIPLGEGVNFSSIGYQHVAISPDGARIGYLANARLYLRTMSDVEPRVILGPDLTGSINNLVFSPDGTAIAFWSGIDRTLKKVAIAGGTSITLCRAEPPFGMAWNADTIVYAEPGKGILGVSANGGNPQILVDSKDQQLHGPQILPGGQSVLFTVASPATGVDRWDKAKVVVQALKTGERKVVIEGGSDGRYVPTGHLVYATGGVLFAVPFDLKRLATVGGATPIVEGIRRGTATAAASGAAQYAFSNTGSLVYEPGPASTSVLNLDIALIDRQGTVEPLRLTPAPYEFPRRSPDGKQLAFGIDDTKDAAVWMYDLSGKTSMRRLTIGGRNRFPIWTADGQRVAFQSDREGDSAVFWQRADGTGTAERITRPDQGVAHIPESWSPQGDLFLFTALKNAEYSLWTYSVQSKKAAPFGEVRSRLPINSTFSPDGRWVAYSSTENGNATIYVQPVPPTGAKYPISKATEANHHHPVWSADGSDLLYLIGPGPAQVVAVTTTPSFTFSSPVPVPKLFLEFGPTTARTFDVLRDKRIVGIVYGASSQTGAAALPHLQVVTNWFEELKQRAGGK